MAESVDRPVRPGYFSRASPLSGIAERVVLTYPNAAVPVGLRRRNGCGRAVQTSLLNPAESFTLTIPATTKEIDPFAAR